MAQTDLLTRCTTCREPLVISGCAKQMARPITCSACGITAPLWYFAGRTNREIAQLEETELSGTWEGARP